MESWPPSCTAVCGVTIQAVKAGGCEHVLIRDTFPRDTLVLPESEATIEGRISDQDAPAGPTGTQRVKASLDQCASDTLSLVIRKNCHRPEQEPAR